MLDVTNGEPGAMPTAPVQAEQQAGGTAGMADSEQPGLRLEDALRQANLWLCENNQLSLCFSWW